jgi:hypothetical protein
MRHGLEAHATLNVLVVGGSEELKQSAPTTGPV